MIKRIFFLFLVNLIFFISGFIFSLSRAEEGSVELLPIKIRQKAKTSLSLWRYTSFDAKKKTLFGDSFQNLLGKDEVLDLQSRSPKNAVQQDFSLRGSNFEGVGILLDGLSLNDPQSGHHNANLPFTKEDLQRVSINLGPNALSCFLGSLDFELKKPLKDSLVWEGSLDSNHTKSALVSMSKKNKDFGLRFSLEESESKGFYPGMDFKKTNLNSYSLLNSLVGEFDFFLGYLEKEYGAFDFYTPGMGFFSKEWTKTLLLNTGYMGGDESFSFLPRFLWRRNWDKFMLDKTQLRSRYLNHHQTDLFNGRLLSKFDFSDKESMSLGLDYIEEGIVSTRLSRHRRRRFSLFGQQLCQLNGVFKIGLDLRGDFLNFKDTEFLGALNLDFLLGEIHRLGLGLGRSFRLPSFTELYYSDPTTKGDPNLKREGALNFQLRHIYSPKDSYLSTAIFLRKDVDAIDWIKEDAHQAFWQAKNINRTTTYGLENMAEFFCTSFFTVKTSYAFTRQLRSSSYLYKYGPNYSQHMAKIVLDFDLLNNRQEFSLSYKKRPSRSGWVLADLLLRHQLKKELHFWLKIANLFNTEYQDIPGIPQPKRTFELGLRWQW